MIDAFLRTNTPITDIPKALSGFDCNCVLVRNDGPTEIWHRTDEGWERSQPGMTLYEDLRPDYIDLCAYRSEWAASDLVEGGMPLVLEHGEAQEWLAAMERNRYALEDAIGCTVAVEHEGQEIICASALFALSEFKSLSKPSTALDKKILAWVDRALAAGADQVGVAIAIASTKGGGLVLSPSCGCPQ